MGIQILPNGTETVVTPKTARRGFTLAELYKLTECQCVQMVPLADGRTMIVDENAKIKAEQPPNNLKATLLFRSGRVPTDEMILGTVLVCNKGEIR